MTSEPSSVPQTPQLPESSSGDEKGSRPINLSFKNILWPLLLSLVVLVLIGYFTFDHISFKSALSTINPWFLLAALGTVVFRVIFGAWRFSFISRGQLGFRQGLRGQLAWDFFSNVTPAALGGGPFAALYVARDSRTFNTREVHPPGPSGKTSREQVIAAVPKTSRRCLEEDKPKFSISRACVLSHHGSLYRDARWSALMLPSQRTLFEIPRDVCYLNAASWSPLPKATLEAGRAAVGRKGTPWTLDASFSNRQHERARKAASHLINAAPDDVALISSVGYGVAVAAKVLTVPRGSRVVVLQDDHSSPVLEWQTRAEAQGFTIETVA
jgi:hypothetical protein